MGKIKKLEKLPNQASILIIGIPGPGLIGTMSLSYVIHSLKMNIIGEMQSAETTAVVYIENGEILGPIRIYRTGKIYAVLSDIPIDYDLAPGFSRSVIDFAVKNRIDVILLLGGIHSADRNANQIETYGLVTSEVLEGIMYENDIPKFLSGMIAGPDATILAYLKKSPVPSLILYTQCNFFFPDPESASHTIKTISKIIKREIDLTEFKKKIDFLRLQGRQLMDDTLSVIQQEKGGQIPPEIYK